MQQAELEATSRMAIARRNGGATGNLRLTAVVGASLIVLLAVEGATIPWIQPLLTVHIFVGMLLLGPVALKLAATGYRVLRYYGGSAGYVQTGPPAALMRVLVAPILVLSTLALFGTGVGLLGVRERCRDRSPSLHKASFIVWFGATAIHVLGSTRGEAPPRIRACGADSSTDWRDRRPRRAALRIHLGRARDCLRDPSAGSFVDPFRIPPPPSPRWLSPACGYTAGALEHAAYAGGSACPASPRAPALEATAARLGSACDRCGHRGTGRPPAGRRQARRRTGHDADDDSADAAPVSGPRGARRSPNDPGRTRCGSPACAASGSVERRRRREATSLRRTHGGRYFHGSDRRARLCWRSGGGPSSLGPPRHSCGGDRPLRLRVRGRRRDLAARPDRAGRPCHGRRVGCREPAGGEFGLVGGCDRRHRRRGRRLHRHGMAEHDRRLPPRGPRESCGAAALCRSIRGGCLGRRASRDRRRLPSGRVGRVGSLRVHPGQSGRGANRQAARGHDTCNGGGDRVDRVRDRRARRSPRLRCQPDRLSVDQLSEDRGGGRNPLAAFRPCERLARGSNPGRGRERGWGDGLDDRDPRPERGPLEPTRRLDGQHRCLPLRPEEHVERRDARGEAARLRTQ